MMVLPKFLKFHVHEAWPISFLKISISCQHGLLCWMVRIPKYFGTCLCTSSQRNSPSLCCKVVVYSVNYSFCLKQISLNQFWNRISIISISYSCTSMWLQKELTLLHGQFLTVRCEHYQICVKKSWSEFNQGIQLHPNWLNACNLSLPDLWTCLTMCHISRYLSHVPCLVQVVFWHLLARKQGMTGWLQDCLVTA